MSAFVKAVKPSGAGKACCGPFLLQLKIEMWR